MTSPSQLRQTVGQLLIMGFGPSELNSALQGILRAIQPGGVILFTRNIHGAQQTFELLQECQRSVTESLFRCIDLEGGAVDRLRDALRPVPAVADVSATEDRKLFRRHGRLIGEEIRAFGFNVNFAPVLDLGFPASRAVLGTRTASADPRKTTVYAHEFLRGLSDAGVLGCGKHFPGLGEANLDTHRELPQVRKSFEQLWGEDLLPYRQLRRGLPFVMVAHASFPDVTGDVVPATLSDQWIHHILRKKIGYDGLILADDLEMGGVTLLGDKGGDRAGEPGTIEYAAVTTIEAGADMFLVCHNEDKAWRSYEAVLREAERDRKFRRRVENAAQHVRKLKKKSSAFRKPFKPPTPRALANLRHELEKLAGEVEGKQKV